MGDGANTPYGQHPACECDWTYHHGQNCPNTATHPAAAALCHACHLVCTAERGDGKPARLSDGDYNRRVEQSDNWGRLRTYLRTLGDGAPGAGRVLAHMDGIEERRKF